MKIINASTSKHFEDIAKLSKIVWHHTYDSIIGYDQVEYMTDKFQSKTAIEKDINDNSYEYLVIYKNNELVAYSGAKIYEKIGFITIDSVVTDIGNGFVMDDYIMEKAI